MSVNNDNRPRVAPKPPPPPPKPKVEPKKEVAACNTDAPAPEARPAADPTRQTDARRVFQANAVQGVREGVTESAGPQPRRGVQSGEARIDTAMRAVDRAPDDDARRDAT